MSWDERQNWFLRVRKEFDDRDTRSTTTATTTTTTSTATTTPDNKKVIFQRLIYQSLSRLYCIVRALGCSNYYFDSCFRSQHYLVEYSSKNMMSAILLLITLYV